MLNLIMMIAGVIFIVPTLFIFMKELKKDKKRKIRQSSSFKIGKVPRLGRNWDTSTYSGVEYFCIILIAVGCSLFIAGASSLLGIN